MMQISLLSFRKFPTNILIHPWSSLPMCSSGCRQGKKEMETKSLRGRASKGCLHGYPSQRETRATAVYAHLERTPPQPAPPCRARPVSKQLNRSLRCWHCCEVSLREALTRNRFNFHHATHRLGNSNPFSRPPHCSRAGRCPVPVRPGRAA